MKKSGLPSSKQTSLDEMFCHDDHPVTASPAPTGLVVTGLSEEEDAARLIAHRFDTELSFCHICGDPIRNDGTGADRFACDPCWNEAALKNQAIWKRRKR